MRIYAHMHALDIS